MTVSVTLLVFPALSVAVITIVFVPSIKVQVFVKLPSPATDTADAVPLFNFPATVTGLLVVSFVDPITDKEGTFT